MPLVSYACPMLSCLIVPILRDSIISFSLGFQLNHFKSKWMSTWKTQGDSPGDSGSQARLAFRPVRNSPQRWFKPHTLCSADQLFILKAVRNSHHLYESLRSLPRPDPPLLAIIYSGLAQICELQFSNNTVQQPSPTDELL